MTCERHTRAFARRVVRLHARRSGCRDQPGARGLAGRRSVRRLFHRTGRLRRRQLRRHRAGAVARAQPRESGQHDRLVPAGPLGRRRRQGPRRELVVQGRAASPARSTRRRPRSPEASSPATTRASRSTATGSSSIPSGRRVCTERGRCASALASASAARGLRPSRGAGSAGRGSSRRRRRRRPRTRSPRRGARSELSAPGT